MVVLLFTILLKELLNHGYYIVILVYGISYYIFYYRILLCFIILNQIILKFYMDHIIKIIIILWQYWDVYLICLVDIIYYSGDISIYLHGTSLYIINSSYVINKSILLFCKYMVYHYFCFIMVVLMVLILFGMVLILLKVLQVLLMLFLKLNLILLVVMVL